MVLRFYYNPDNDLPHICDHDVTETEVEDVLRAPQEDAKSRRGSRVAIGRTHEIGDGIFVVTAYDLVGKPLAAFRRRMRKRQR